MDTEVKEEDGSSPVPPSKRYRRDDNVDPTNPDPSIVVHVRNLSPKATEADLLEALSHFGPISYATCMPGKRMALVEFEEVEGARSCVVYAQTNQIYVAGQAALFNYSTSKMIQRLGLESETPNHVLILTIYNAQYPVNVDVIHQICEPHGFVKRIAMIRRTMLQALVEFESAEIAKKAKHAMNGADIYSGCCTLKVEFAKPEHVKVTRNDQDQWDYTKAPQSAPSYDTNMTSYRENERNKRLHLLPLPQSYHSQLFLLQVAYGVENMKPADHAGLQAKFMCCLEKVRHCVCYFTVRSMRGHIN